MNMRKELLPFLLAGTCVFASLAGEAPEVGRTNVASAEFGGRAEVTGPDGAITAAPQLIDNRYGDMGSIMVKGAPFTVTIHLPMPCMINQVRIFPGRIVNAGNPSGDAGVKAYRIEALYNGHWNIIVEAADQPDFLSSGASGGNEYFYAHSFKPIRTEAVRMVVTESGDTGRRVSNDRVLPPAERQSCIREIEIYSADRREAGVKLISSLLTGDFQFSVYRDQDRAMASFTGTEDMKRFKASWRLAEEKSGKVHASGEREFAAGINDFSFDLGELPDGRYILTIEPDAAEKFLRGPLRRMLRLERAGREQPPAEPVAVGGIRVFPVDDFHFAARVGVTEASTTPETFEATRPLAPGRTEQRNSGTDFLEIREDGVFSLKFYDATGSHQDRRPHYAYSRDLENWTIADEPPDGRPNRKNVSPFAPLPSAAEEKWRNKTPLAKATLRFYDAARDGKPPLAEVRAHYFHHSTRSHIEKYGLRHRALYPVWEKEAGEWIVLTREPLNEDKGYAFEAEELESENDGNDNFGSQFLTDDGRTLIAFKAQAVRRFPPYTVQYDNLPETARTMRVYYTHDGFDWKSRYLAAPGPGDSWSYQHYSFWNFRVDRDFRIGYINTYDCVRQQIYPEIVYSRNGLDWRRLPSPKPFISNTPPGTWLFGMIFLRGDHSERDGKYYVPIGGVASLSRPHFYDITYRDDLSHITGRFLSRSFGARGLADHWPFFKAIGGWEGLAKHMREASDTLGLAVFRKDGWIAVRAGDDGGVLESRLFSAAEGMKLNGRGEFTVEVLDARGTLSPDYGGVNAARLSGDWTDAPLTWKGGAIDRLPQDPFRIRITMKPGSELFCLYFSKMTGPRPPTAMTRIAAHGGGSRDFPENTLTAARGAAAQGAEFWEFDVRLTKDHIPVLMHDNTPERTTDAERVFPERLSNLISTFTLDDLRQLDATARYVHSEREGEPSKTVFAPEPVPLLDEALALSKELGLSVFAELKGSDPLLARMTADRVKNHGMEDRTILTAFDEKMLLTARERLPDIRIMPICRTVPPDLPKQLLALGAYGVALAYQEATPEFMRSVQKVQEAGFFVTVWTVNDPECMKTMFDIGVDFLVTDRPDAAVRERTARKSGIANK